MAFLLFKLHLGDFGSFIGGFWQFLYSNSTKGMLGHLLAVFGSSYIQTPLRGFWVIYRRFLTFLIFKLLLGDFGSFIGGFWQFLYLNSTKGILGHLQAIFGISYIQTSLRGFWVISWRFLAVLIFKLH